MFFSCALTSYARRRFSLLLGAIFYRKHDGRHVHETWHEMSARRPHVHIDHLARLHEQFRQSRYLHYFQSGISKSIQENHENQVNSIIIINITNARPPAAAVERCHAASIISMYSMLIYAFCSFLIFIL